MADKSRSGVSEDEAERLRDLDSIPGMAKFYPELLNEIFEISGVEVNDAFEFKRQLDKIPEDELRSRLYRNFLLQRDPAELNYIFEAVQGAAAINRHDALQAGKRFTPVEHLQPLPWIWVTGEPNTDRAWTMTFIIKMCAERDFGLSKLVDCEWDNAQLVLKKLFGSYFAPDRPNQEQTPMLVNMDAAFLGFYKADKMSPKLQMRLIQWRQNSLRRVKVGWEAQSNSNEIRNRKISGDSQKLGDTREEIEFSDVAIFFIADRAPWELVEQGIVRRELVSGSIHIPVPPLRECPKLLIRRLRSFIIDHPTLKTLVPDPLKYWSKEALDLVSSFNWPDNLAGLRGLVDNLFFKGLLRSGKDKITEDHIRGALWDMYGPASLAVAEHPVRAGSNEIELPPKAQEPLPDPSQWPRIFMEEFQGKPGAVTAMHRKYGMNRSLLSTTLNAAGINTGKGGRPRKDTR